MQGLSKCVEEAEFRQEKVEDQAAEAIVARCKRMEQQRTAKKSLSRRNNIFVVAEGEEGSY